MDVTMQINNNKMQSWLLLDGEPQGGEKRHPGPDQALSLGLLNSQA